MPGHPEEQTVKQESQPALPRSSEVGAEPEGALRSLPDKLLEKCPNCKDLLVGKDLGKNLRVCPRCGYHFKLDVDERIRYLVDDPDAFEPFADELRSGDPLGFSSNGKSYLAELDARRRATGLSEAVVVGESAIEGMPLVLAVMDFRFIGGSMGSVVGERITQAIERAAKKRIPLLIVSASGGARMQEGLLSLMQMAKTSAALTRLAEAGAPFISLLTDPTTGGVLASFAMLGDVILAEPGAVIGFAGPRVVEQFTHQKLPRDTNTSEFVLQHGMIDAVVHRRDLRSTLARLLRFYSRPRD